jgi:hypothetical protein
MLALRSLGATPRTCHPVPAIKLRIMRFVAPKKTAADLLVGNSS